MDFISLSLQGATEEIFFFGVMFIVTLAIVINVHEFGHYIAARLCKVHVETFAFGFGKEIFGFGGKEPFKTRWSVCILPIGGFVKLFGDVDVNKPIVWDHENNCERTLSADELKVSFCTKNIWQRAFIIAAGPGINLLLTFLIFAVLFSTYGQKSKTLVINSVVVDSASYKAGIKIGDELVDMDGEKIRRLEDVYDLTWYEDPAVEHEYKIIRNGEVMYKNFTAKRIEYINKKGVELNHGQTGMLRMRAIKFDEMSSIEGVLTEDEPDKARELFLQNMDKEIRIGIPFKGMSIEKVDIFLMKFDSALNTHLDDPDDVDYERAWLIDPDDKFFLRLGVFEALKRSAFLMKEGVVDSYKIIEAIYKGRNNEDAVLGGVGKISQYTAKAAKAGIYDYLIFVAGFSLMIAMVNLLPIPVLDGGYLVFILYEAIAGKTASSRVQDISMIIGMLFLIGLMVFANLNDLASMLTDTDAK